MMTPAPHIPDDEILLALECELGEARTREVSDHLAHCWTCRARRNDFERGIGEFVELRKSASAAIPIPSAEGPVARLRAQMALAVSEQGSTNRSLGTWWRRHAMPAGVCIAMIALSALGLVFFLSAPRPAGGPLPDGVLTPGATRLISKDQVCVAPADDDRHTPPLVLANQVFQRYRIVRPAPGTYEVDYLISPSLGGAEDVRNLWPQPYSAGEWSSRVKDALEDHLRRLVCEGSMDLATAQREIAADWIGAYRKHFRSRHPLAAHAVFVKDRPWE